MTIGRFNVGAVIAAALCCSGAFASNGVPPANDDVCNAEEITLPLALGVPFNIADATAEAGEVNPGVGTWPDPCRSPNGWCAADTGVQNSVWFWFIAPVDAERMVVRAVDATGGSNNNFQVAIWRAQDCANWATFTEIGANDNTFSSLNSEVYFDVIANQRYYIQIDGYLGVGTEGQVIIFNTPRPTNDQPCNAQPMAIPTNWGVFTGSATIDGGEPSPGVGSGTLSCVSDDGWCAADPDIQRTVWFSFVAPECGGVRLFTYETDPPAERSGPPEPGNYQMAVYSASDCSDYSTFFEIAANDNQSGAGGDIHPLLDLCFLTPGETYYVQIDGFEGDNRPGVAIQIEELLCFDCNNNGLEDACEILDGAADDCNGNSVPDTCEVALGDCNSNGIPDDCEPDCNANEQPDDCDIADGISDDCNGNGIPDECEPDCNNNGVPDDCDIADTTSPDCNFNGVPDECDLAADPSLDSNGDGLIDSCTANAGDTNGDAVVNYIDLLNVLQNLYSPGPLGDVNYDGWVTFADYIIVIWNYGNVYDE